MENIPTDAKSMRSFIKTKSLPRVNIILEKAGVSEEEKELLLLRYKNKFSVTKVARLKITNTSSVSRKCTRAMQQLLDFTNFCKNFSINLDLF